MVSVILELLSCCMTGDPRINMIIAIAFWAFVALLTGLSINLVSFIIREMISLKRLKTARMRKEYNRG